MCNAYRLKSAPAEIAAFSATLGLPLVSIPNDLPSITMTRPTNTLPVFRPADPASPRAGLEMVSMRWWMVPFFHKGPDVKAWKAMCTNARADKLKGGATWREPYKKRRALVIADGFIEWTGPAGSKTRWLIERADGKRLVFPAIWDRWNSPEGPVESFAIITTDPGPEMAEYHNRQPVILEDEQAAEWLDLATDPAEAFERAGAPAGALKFSLDQAA